MPPVERVLNFDILGMQQRAYVGIRRAAAFLGLSERFLEGDFPRSLTLGQSIKLQFLPDPFPAEAEPELRENWRSWIVGNSLRELDQFLSLFLDDAYDIVQQAKLVSGESPPNFQWRRLERITNVADKHFRVLDASGLFDGPHLDDQRCLVSLSLARNCLSHDLGIVTPKRATNGQLTVRWLALRTIVQQGDKTFVMEDQNMPFQLDPNGPNGSVLVRVEAVEKSYLEGDPMRFSPDDLLGICLFYQMVIDRVAQALAEYAKACGVVFD